MQPNRKYFFTARGEWSSPFQLRIVNWGAFFRSRVNLLNKLRVLAFLVWMKLFGAPTLFTRVTYDGSQIVGHFTWIKQFGLTLYRAEETFHLAPNGRDLTINAREWQFPLLWLERTLAPGRGSVGEAANRATYSWHWLGEDWIMENRQDGDLVEVNIFCDWACGIQRLRRFST